jgi:hypothetical protein
MQVRQAIGSEQRHERMENDVWCGAGSEKIGGENKKITHCREHNDAIHFS